MEREELRKKLYEMVDEFVEVCGLDSEYILLDKEDYTNMLNDERFIWYVNGMKDLHNSDIYQEAVGDYGEWSQEGMDKGFVNAKRDLISILKTKEDEK